MTQVSMFILWCFVRKLFSFDAFCFRKEKLCTKGNFIKIQKQKSELFKKYLENAANFPVFFCISYIVYNGLTQYQQYPNLISLQCLFNFEDLLRCGAYWRMALKGGSIVCNGAINLPQNTTLFCEAPLNLQTV